MVLGGFFLSLSKPSCMSMVLAQCAIVKHDHYVLHNNDAVMWCIFASVTQQLKIIKSGTTCDSCTLTNAYTWCPKSLKRCWWRTKTLANKVYHQEEESNPYTGFLGTPIKTFHIWSERFLSGIKNLRLKQVLNYQYLQNYMGTHKVKNFDIMIHTKKNKFKSVRLFFWMM